MEISKKGNAVGFTATGETISGQYLAKARCWAVTITSPLGSMLLSDARNRRFADVTAAKAYAAGLINADKTEELKWW